MSFSNPPVINEYPSRKVFFFEYGRSHIGKLAYKHAVRVYNRTRVAEAQNWKCCFCGCQMKETPGSKDSVTLEHVDPLALGGSDSPANYAASCYNCNNKKADTPLEDFLAGKTATTSKKVLRRLKSMKKYVKSAEKKSKEGWDNQALTFKIWFDTLRLPKNSKSRLLATLQELGYTQ